ncbi:Integrase core domain protein [Streptomyces sp. ADI95-17]|nr:Integrase core domain protein [Streptomyces sp. ADI95-17]
MAEPVRVRRVTDQKGQKLQQIVRRGSTNSVRYRRAMMLLASAGGNRVPVIAHLVQADEDTVRDVIHHFNEIGLAGLDPQWAGGRPRLLSADDEDFVIRTATPRPTKLGRPFTHWSLHKLVAYPRKLHGRIIRIGREALRCMLARRGVTFQRTKTWKEPPTRTGRRSWTGSRRSSTASRTGSSLSTSSACSGTGSPRARAGPLRSAPTGWPPLITALTACATSTADTHSATTPCGATNQHKKGAANTLAALKSIRAARPGGAPNYVILDNLSAHKDTQIHRGARKNRVELCFTPPYTSWANPIEAHFGPLSTVHHRQLQPPNHPVQTRALHAHLRRRNDNARHSDVLAAQRRERAPVSAARRASAGADALFRRPDHEPQG